MAYSTGDHRRSTSSSTKSSSKRAVEIKTCAFLRNDSLSSPRIVAAGIYLPDGTVAFIDRNNSQLLIANVEEETFVEIDLKPPLSDGASYDPLPNLPLGRPSDVNGGFKQNELLITFTHADTSTVVLYEVSERLTLSVVSRINVPSRTRSAAVLDDGHIVVTSSEYVHVLSRDGITHGSKSRIKRDRGGLMMADRRNGRFFYGDGDDFVCCQWKNRRIQELFRFRNPRMKFPRGSALDDSGHILICCDSSRNVFRVDPDGNFDSILVQGTGKAYGDVDLLGERLEFFTTFWGYDEWPIIFRLYNA